MISRCYYLDWLNFWRETNDEKLYRVKIESNELFEFLSGKAIEKTHKPCEVYKRIKHTGRRRLSRSCC